jgi:putative transposase
MANTYTSLHFHIVFSTKRGEPWLTEGIRGRVWPYLGGIARENGMAALEIGGVSDQKRKGPISTRDCRHVR